MNHELALSVEQAPTAVGLGRATRYELLQAGEGPDVVKVGCRTLATRAARERWRALRAGAWASRRQAGELGPW